MSEGRKLYQSGKPPLYWRHRIAALREKRGKTQQQLADAAGMNRPNLAVIETYGREPSVGTLLRIAKVLNVSLDDLVEVVEEGSDE